MFEYLIFPFDTIKTNRIVKSFLSKEGTDSPAREILALYQKGGIQNGLYRGLNMTLAF